MNVSQALSSIDRRLEVMTGVLVDQVGELRELRHASDRQMTVLERQSVHLARQTEHMERQTGHLARQTEQLARQTEQLGRGTDRTDALTEAVLRALERLDRQDREEG